MLYQSELFDNFNWKMNENHLDFGKSKYIYTKDDWCRLMYHK